MSYLHLLSPQGEPFEVPEHRAGKLLTEGWSFNPAPLENAELIAVSGDTVAEEPQEFAGAVANAESFAEDAPVEVVDTDTEAGPQEDVNDNPNFTDIRVAPEPVEAPVAEEERPAKKSRRND